MPRVNFIPSGKSIEVKAGTSLYDAARSIGLPVAASCSEEFVCGKCDMAIVDGAQNLSKQTERERALLRREGKSAEHRVSCCTAIWGDCSVTTSYW